MSLRITNVRLPSDTARLDEKDDLYAVVCEDGKVRSVAKMREGEDFTTLHEVEEGEGDEGGVADSDGHGIGPGAHERKKTVAMEVLDGEGGLLLPS